MNDNARSDTDSGKLPVYSLFDQRIQRDEIAFRLRHLFIVLHLQKFSVQPAIAPLMSQISLALGNFVFMVYRHMVNTAAVNIQMRPQMFYRHRRAFDMPARITAPPFGIPLQNLILNLEDVNHNTNQIHCACFHRFPPARHASNHRVSAPTGCRKPEIWTCQNKRSRLKIGIAFTLQLFHKLNHILNMLGCAADNIRPVNIQSLRMLENVSSYLRAMSITVLCSFPPPAPSCRHPRRHHSSGARHQ